MKSPALYFKTILTILLSTWLIPIHAAEMSGPFAFVQMKKNWKIVEEGISVTLRLARGNVMTNSLSVINRSRDTIQLFCNDVFLLTEDSSILVHAVPDFHLYVKARLNTARNACEELSNFRCSDTMETFFKDIGRKKSFVFGAIPPGKKQTGLIAFNLPEPFNRSPEARQVSDGLKPDPWLREGVIEITIIKDGRPVYFIFPVRVGIFSNREYLPMSILNFNGLHHYQMDQEVNR